ncbi:hypothetical protein M3C97_011800, partial [Micrococcus luteus]|nr:hypothetical protein [Micrococcus luteus]
LNDALGRGLVDAGLIASYETEKPLGSDFKFTSDIYAVVGKEPVRIEIMWRSETGRATIANYVLTKLGNYAKAIGLLQ